MANSRPSSALDDVAALDVESTEARRTESSLRLLLGASLVRPFWGWAPMDWGLPSASVLRTVPTALQKPTKSDMDAAVQAPKKQHKAHGHAHGTPRTFYRLPVRRHQWGDQQYELHASWADLFHDLIYVGAAYQLGSVVKASFYCTEKDGSGSSGSSDGGGGTLCVGLAIGVFYSMALFQCLVRLWLSDLFLHNRYEASDLAHRLHDCVTYLFIAMAASGILPAATALELGPSTFDVPLLIALSLVMLRYLELALLSPDIAVRRSCAMMVVDLSLTFLCWMLAIVTYPHAQQQQSSEVPSTSACSWQWHSPALPCPIAFICASNRAPRPALPSTDSLPALHVCSGARHCDLFRLTKRHREDMDRFSVPLPRRSHGRDSVAVESLAPRVVLHGRAGETLSAR